MFCILRLQTDLQDFVHQLDVFSLNQICLISCWRQMTGIYRHCETKVIWKYIIQYWITWWEQNIWKNLHFRFPLYPTSTWHQKVNPTTLKRLVDIHEGAWCRFNLIDKSCSVDPDGEWLNYVKIDRETRHRILEDGTGKHHHLIKVWKLWLNVSLPCPWRRDSFQYCLQSWWEMMINLWCLIAICVKGGSSISIHLDLEKSIC